MLPAFAPDTLIIMRTLHSLVSFIESTIALFGRAIAWLSLLMMLTTCAVVILRYGLEIGFIALQESITYMHAILFMLGVAYAFQNDAHVRVDILYRRFTPRTQAWINSFGGIVLLLPFCVFTTGISWDFFYSSWLIRETSSEASGIPAVYLLKLLIPLMAIGLFFQGTADVLRNLLLLMEHQTDDDHPHHGPTV